MTGRSRWSAQEPHHPYERPPLSKDVLAPTIARAEMDQPAPNGSPSAASTASPAAAAIAIDRQRKTVELCRTARRCPTTSCCSRPARCRAACRSPGLGSASPICATYADALAIRAICKPGSHLAIIGGGFIGLELAASARKRGADVTVIEAQPRILMRGVPAEIAEVIAERHRAEVRHLVRRGLNRSSKQPARGPSSSPTARRSPPTCVVIGIGAMPVHRARRSGRAGARQRHRRRRDAARRPIPTSSPPATAAPSRCRSMAAAACGWNPGATRRSRARSPRPTCWAPASRSPSVPWFWSDQYDLTLQVAGLADGAATHGAPRSRRRRLHPVPPGRRRPAARGERHRPGQCRRPRHQARRDADRQRRPASPGATRPSRASS